MNNFFIISYSFCKGGAAIAANKFFVMAKQFNNFNVVPLSQDNAGLFQFVKRLISHFFLYFQYDDNPIKHSLNLFSYKPVLNSFKRKEDLHHIHWINNDTLSLFSFKMIPVGSIVTLHDEWLYCGSEHVYKITDKKLDFANGYSFKKNGLIGLNLNYIAWKLKYKYLSSRDDIVYTVPSRWMKLRAEESLILRGKNINILPNPIDTNLFLPYSRTDIDSLRKQWGFEPTDFIFCFGAVGGSKNKLKGNDLLFSALEELRLKLDSEQIKRIKILQFGGFKNLDNELAGFVSVSAGYIDNPRKLAELYNISDCVVVPSLVESFGQVAAEALSCATPVVCFDSSGLKDIVFNQCSGLTAAPFSHESLASCLYEMFQKSHSEIERMGIVGREYVLNSFSYEVVSEMYFKIIEQSIQIKKQFSIL